MRLPIDQLLPRDHLDAVFECVTAAVDRVETPASRGDVLQSLRRALRVFVRSELGKALDLCDKPALLPERLRPHVPSETESLQTALEDFARRRASQWAAAVIELLGRLQRDWAQLIAQFNLAPDAALARVSSPLGDLHHDGRAVCRVSFSDGQSLIYKPRSVEAECAFGAMLSRLSEHGCRPQFKACRAWTRDGYGWTQYIPTAFCETDEEIGAFYRRQGGFLALFWILCASDAIDDNVVVAGEHPVWIDSECMCHPELGDIWRGRTSFPLWIRESILATAMVLDGIAPEGAPHLRRQTGLSVSCTGDGMRTFTADGVLRPPFIRAVVQGFEDVYRWFLLNGRARSLDDGPLALCCDLHVRVILRATRAYDVLVNLLAITPESAREPVCVDICHVLRVGTPPHSGPFPESIVQAETFALLKGDIPYWSASTSSRDLQEAHGACASSVATATCVECIEQRLARMSETDLARQAWLLESFLGGGTHAPGVR